jgi:hypothetical protein
MPKVPRSRRVLAALAVALAAAVPAPAYAHTAAAPPNLWWVSPTPLSGSTLRVGVGQTLSVPISARDIVPTVAIHITAVSLPSGAALTAVDGNPGTATLVWTPTEDQAGTYDITINATENLPLPAKPLPLLLRIVVNPLVGTETLLTDGELSQWAYVDRGTVARSAPSPGAQNVAKVSAWTPENYPNLVLLLKQRYEQSGWWVQARLSTLPNGRVGWLPRSALGPYHRNTTHLYVNRSALSATLMKDGKQIFTTRVAVGRPYWPTPRGEFYIREKVTGFHNPMYGPIAYGTSARSPVLTDWPGGGFIGVHGTNEPGLIPGRVSHGCVRLRNSAILKLARLLPLGTPLTID